MIIRGDVEREMFVGAVRQFRGVDTSGRFLDASGTISFLAVHGDAVVGWCWGQHIHRPDDASMLYLHELDVAPAHRNQGFGKALVDAFLSEGRILGATKAFLVTGMDNGPARALYEGLGFEPAEQGATISYWIQLTPIARTG